MTSESTKAKPPLLKYALLGAILVIAFFLYHSYGDQLTLSSLADRETQLSDYAKNNPWLAMGAVFAVYVIVTGLSIPGAAVVLTLGTAWFFGFPKALIIVSFASTAGATLAFLTSRFLLRDQIQERFHKHFEKANKALEKEGAYYLFSLRLIPVVPFFVINLVMGLTALPTRTFWWVSQLGMLPGTAIYVYTGASIPSLQELSENGIKGILTPQILAAFILLGLFPLAVKRLMKKFRGKLPTS